MRILLAMVLVLTAAGGAACSGTGRTAGPYGAQGAAIGTRLTVLGWDMTVSDLRWEADHVLVDVAAAAEDPTDPTTPRARAQDIRFGLYGNTARPMESTGIGSCDPLLALAARPLSAPVPDRLSGTVCLGPVKERSAVRGVYVYSPSERIPETTVAYGVAFPVGVAPGNPADTGLTLTNRGVTAWRANGTPLTPAALGDPAAFTGNGYLLLSLAVDGVAARYREDSVARGGPMMLVAAPSTPLPGMDPACSAAGSSVLVLPEASLNAVHVNTSLCTHGEINAAVLYASLSVIGTHAAVWTAS